MIKRLLLSLALFMLLSLLVAQNSITDSYNLEASGNYTEALRIMQGLAEQEPGEAFYQVRIAWLQYLLGQYQNAQGSYRASLQILDNLDAWTGIINCNLALANWTEARRIAGDLLTIHAQNPTILGKAAYASYMMQDYQASAAIFGRITELYPWDMENRGYLLNNLYLAGRIEEAREQYNLLKKYYPASAMLTEYRNIFE
mgnify:CR=1 FL=1